MGEPIQKSEDKLIYRVERGTVMNGHEMIYDDVAYFSTLDKAKKFVEKEFYEFLSYGEEINKEEDFRMLKVNHKYWSTELDCESTMGIMAVKLDKPLYED